MLPINRKGLHPYDMVNRMFVLAFSNDPVPISLDSQDRRWFCVWSTAPRMNPETAAAMWRWYKSGGYEAIAHWLHPVFAETIEASGHAEEAFSMFGIDGALMLASVAVAALGISFAWRLFGAGIGPVRVTPQPERVTALSARAPFLYRASLNKWWFDELNDLLFIRLGGVVASSLWWFDRRVIDGAVNGVGALAGEAGRELRRIQTGRVQNYALGIAVGLLVMAVAFLAFVGR